MIVDVVLRLAAVPLSVAAARRMVSEALSIEGVQPVVIQDIRLAMSEACTNVILHGSEESTYEVSVHLRADRCELVVRDAGTDVDIGRLPVALPPVTSTSGRGLAIMRAVMDEVHLSVESGRGTVVRLVKRLHPRS